ncbi:MAG: GGDEF domain-containing protein [Bdellovibrionota bacterium]
MTPLRGALWGAILAQGAPLGWFVIDTLFGGANLRVVTLLYLEIATTAVLSFVGWLLFRRGQELEELNERLAVLARHDPLTSLANAGAFHEELERELARADRTGQPLSLVLLDLDFFKKVNDQHGHLTGDQVLRRVGMILEREIRTGDLAARYGGEELALILPGNNLEQAAQAAERVRRAIEEGGKQGEIPVPITASFGVAQAAPADSLLGLFARADRALYRAKAEGRNRVCRDQERGTAP